MAATQTGVTLESLGVQRDAKTYRAQYDQNTTTASMGIVTALSEVLAVDPIDLTPIQHTIDTDGLDRLARVQGTTNQAVTINFTYEGYAITVYSHGVVELAPVEYERTDHGTEEIGHI